MSSKSNFIDSQIRLKPYLVCLWGANEGLLSELQECSSSVIERYGGDGIGGHGGGARAANIGGYQCKGIGLTAVAGESENTNYTHGTLALADAVYEAIYSEVLGRVMPVGVAKCHGVLHSGKDAAFEYSGDYANGLNKTHGAILLREICERPGHYLRAGTYKVRAEYKDLICDDVTRIRHVIREFTQQFNNHNEFIAYMGKFLGACANQFSFARVAGIAHGGVTASNLCVDGRWIDLSTSSFLDRGRNYLITHLPFYNEQEISLHVLNEWVYTYCKYNGVDFDITTLVNYYQEQLQAYTHYHSAYALGLPRGVVASLQDKPEYDQLAEELMQVLMPEGRVYVLEHLGFKEDDPLLCYLEASVSAMVDDMESSNQQSILLQLFRRLHQQDDNHYGLATLIKRSLIKAFKRSYLAAFFYRNQVRGSIDAIIESDRVQAFSGFIDDHLAVSDWVFDDQFGTSEIIFKSADLTIELDLENNLYLVGSSDGVSQSFSAIEQLMQSELLQEQNFSICDYDFSAYMLRLASSLSLLDDQ